MIRISPQTQLHEYRIGSIDPTVTVSTSVWVVKYGQC
jgi:hypothetical protein